MFFSRQLGWIGVDVGTHTVKLAQAVREGARVRLHRAAVIERPASWSGDDALAHEQPITSYPEIRAALECGGFSGRNAVCTLPMNLCELRGLNLPPGTDQERRTMAADELADDWAERRTPLEFDFWELEAARGDKPTDTFNVNVLAAPRPWVAQLWRDCRQSGLDCWAIDGVPLALARAVGLLGQVSNGRRALAVDWGFSNTTLAIVGEFRAWYSRRIHDCPFSKVLNSVMNTFGVTREQAQHLVDAFGLTSPDGGQSSADQEIQAAITETVSDALEELVRQLSRTLQFTESQRRHLQPTAVWLMGGGASMRNIDHYLAQELKLPVRVWKLPPAEAEIACAADNRAALFGEAVALSSLGWRAA